MYSTGNATNTVRNQTWHIFFKNLSAAVVVIRRRRRRRGLSSVVAVAPPAVRTQLTPFRRSTLDATRRLSDAHATTRTRRHENHTTRRLLTSRPPAQ